MTLSEPAYYHDKDNMNINSHIHNFVYDFFYNAYLLWIDEFMYVTTINKKA